jgi:SAM-dependent methyltransferase
VKPQPQSNSEWQRLAGADPLHAIASDPGRRRQQDRAWSTEEFFAKGVTLYGLVRSLVLRIADRRRAVDLGCGAGRLSRQLATDFASVIGVDVAPQMVTMARELNRDVANVEFRIGSGDTLPVDSVSSDLVFSLQVLQHIDRDVLPRLILEMARVLVPGGHVLVHIPRTNWRQRFSAMVRLASIRRVMTRLAVSIKADLDVSRWPWVGSQYHTYQPDTVLRWFRSAGLSNVEQLEFRPGNPLTTVYFATK